MGVHLCVSLIKVEGVSTGQEKDREWLVTEKDKFDQDYDRDSNGVLDRDEILSWVVPTNEYEYCNCSSYPLPALLLDAHLLLTIRTPFTCFLHYILNWSLFCCLIAHTLLPLTLIDSKGCFYEVIWHFDYVYCIYLIFHLSFSH